MTTASRKEYLYELLPWHGERHLEGAEKDAVRALLASDLEANPANARDARAAGARGHGQGDRGSRHEGAMVLRRLYRAYYRSAAHDGARWFVPVSMAAAALLTVAGGFGLFMAGERAERFHTLTTPAELPAAPADSVLYRVDVVAGVDAEQLAQLAGVAGVRVLQGPSERGVALIAVPRADAESVASRLSADPHLRFVALVPR